MYYMNLNKQDVLPSIHRSVVIPISYSVSPVAFIPINRKNGSKFGEVLCIYAPKDCEGSKPFDHAIEMKAIVIPFENKDHWRKDPFYAASFCFSGESAQSFVSARQHIDQAYWLIPKHHIDRCWAKLFDMGVELSSTSGHTEMFYLERESKTFPKGNCVNHWLHAGFIDWEELDKFIPVALEKTANVKSHIVTVSEARRQLNSGACEIDCYRNWNHTRPKSGKPKPSSRKSAMVKLVELGLFSEEELFGDLDV